MSDFNQVIIFINDYKSIGFGAIIISVTVSFRKCVYYYFDYLKTVNTNRSKVERERIKAKSREKVNFFK